MKLDDFQIEELLRNLFEISDDIEELDLDEVTYEKFGTDYGSFKAIVETLLPLTPTVESQLTGSVYHAFIKDGLALIKIKARGQQ